MAGVVDRLCGVQAQVASSAELAIRVRREKSRRGEVARALRDGRLIKTWAMRGALHLLTPQEAGTFLSVVVSGRPWERPSWERYFGPTPKEIELLRRTVRAALADGPLTREEVATAVSARRVAYVLAEDVDELVSTPPTSTVRLLPGFDQYVLGQAPRTVTSSSRRAAPR